MKLKSIIYGLTTILLASCVGEDIINNPSISAELSIPSSEGLFSLAIDEDDQNTLKLEPTIFGSNSTENLSLRYSSSNKDVLTVNEIGLLNPIKQGEATITVTLIEEPNENNNALEKIIDEEEIIIIVGVVTLNKREADNLSETEKQKIATTGFDTDIRLGNIITSIDISETEKQSIEAVFVNNKGQEDTTVEINFTSSDENVLTVNSTGEITPISQGNAVITISVDESLSTKSTDIISEKVEINISDTTVVEEVPEEPEPQPTAEVIGSGVFERLDYAINGGFEIITENNETRIELNDSFSTSTLPDLVIYLSNTTASFANAQIISEDINASGAQTFDIPNNVDTSSYRFVLLFCRRFNQPVGFGTIQR